MGKHYNGKQKRKLNLITIKQKTRNELIFYNSKNAKSIKYIL